MWSPCERWNTLPASDLSLVVGASPVGHYREAVCPTWGQLDAADAGSEAQ